MPVASWAKTKLTSSRVSLKVGRPPQPRHDCRVDNIRVSPPHTAHTSVFWRQIYACLSLFWPISFGQLVVILLPTPIFRQVENRSSSSSFENFARRSRIAIERKKPFRWDFISVGETLSEFHSTFERLMAYFIHQNSPMLGD